MVKPNVKEFMEATGADRSTASDLLYGVIGSNVDTRNWDMIMGSSDPVAAARTATRQYYDKGPVRGPQQSDEQRMAAIQADARRQLERRERILGNILSGNIVGTPTGYGFTQEQIDAARAAQQAGQGLGSFLRGEKMQAFAPAQRAELNRRAAEIEKPVEVVFNRRIEGTPLAISGDPDSGKQRVQMVAGDNTPMSGYDPRRIQNFGYDPYTLQPMYDVSQDQDTGDITFTPAFDVTQLGYDFGDLDPYSEAGLSSYFEGPLTSQTFIGDPYNLGYDNLQGVIDRMGYEVTPFDYTYQVR